MYVYILVTTTHTPPKYYIGKTKNLKQCLISHNTGRCKHTRPFRPWTYQNFFWFNEPSKAHSFERYLKSGSGSAFTNKHFSDK